MCGVRMFKTLRQVSASYLRDIIYIKSNAPFIYYQCVCVCVTLCFSHKKRLCFLPDQKNACFLLISHFSPAPAASNYLLPPAGPGLAVLRLVPVSQTSREVTWAWGRRLLQLEARVSRQFSFLFFLLWISCFLTPGVVSDHSYFSVSNVCASSQFQSQSAFSISGHSRTPNARTNL